VLSSPTAPLRIQSPPGWGLLRRYTASPGRQGFSSSSCRPWRRMRYGGIAADLAQLLSPDLGPLSRCFMGSSSVWRPDMHYYIPQGVEVEASMRQIGREARRVRRRRWKRGKARPRRRRGTGGVLSTIESPSPSERRRSGRRRPVAAHDTQSMGCNPSKTVSYSPNRTHTKPVTSRAQTKSYY
jgi:hypothetical protein